jgi:3-keto steroid reductase
MYVVHPGVVATSISGLHWFLAFFMMLTFYVDRWLGSPWHLVTPYKGAVSAAFAVLAPQLAEQEESEGKGKWASAIGVSGHERVARTEVEGWGYCGRVGVVPPGSVTAGLFRDRQITDEERRREFEETGRLVWKEMEAMRREWERLLGPIDAEGEEAAA